MQTSTTTNGRHTLLDAGPARATFPGAWGAVVVDPRIAEVDAAVRAVLSRLAVSQPARPNAGQATAGAAIPPVPLPADAHPFAGRLLALRHVEMLPATIREIRLDAVAVVTPLARDALRRRGIALRLISAGELSRTGARGEWGVCIDRGFPLADPFRRALMAGPQSWLDLGDAADAAAPWVAGGPSRAAVAVTPQAHHAAWTACQVPGVRATAAADPDTLARAARQIAANLLLIDPAGLSISSLLHLCATFRRVGLAQATPSPGQEPAP
jgi:hypothetical protein